MLSSMSFILFYVMSLANFNWLRKEAICYKNLNNDCESCNTLHHFNTGLPYAWQYYEENSWKMFPSNLNTALEKCFCDPNNDVFK